MLMKDELHNMSLTIGADLLFVSDVEDYDASWQCSFATVDFKSWLKALYELVHIVVIIASIVIVV